MAESQLRDVGKQTDSRREICAAPNKKGAAPNKKGAAPLVVGAPQQGRGRLVVATQPLYTLRAVVGRG